MYYSISGNLTLSGLPKGENAIGKVINRLMSDSDSGFESYVEQGRLEEIEQSPNSLYVDKDGDFDEMDDLKAVFIYIISEITKAYPESHLKVKFRGTNSSTGDAYIINLEMKDRHVQRIDMDGGEEDIYCPECDEWIMSLGDLEFGSDYKCDECGHTMSPDDIIETMEDFDIYSEYNV